MALLTVLRRLAVLAVAACLAASTAAAQQPPADPAVAQAPATTPQQQEERPCPGCPPRRLGKAFLQVTIVNGFYELANLVRGQATAHITPETWWINMKRGWEWDLDDFTVNQIGHPYQGNNYFTTGRANGLNYWESAAITAFGSGTWEYFGETNQASLNDFINTTMGGIALGEMFHRAAWLVRDPRATGKSRTFKEIGAMAIDPMTGINRYLSGDASRVEDKPSDMVPSQLGATTSFGVAARGSNTSSKPETVDPFLEVDLLYGDLENGRSRTPYDAFAVRLGFGGGSPFSEVKVRGRLLGQPFHNGGLQVSVLQGYQYNKNSAYQFGAQSVEVLTSTVHEFSSQTSMWAGLWGGLTILGAVDSIPPGSSGVDEPVDPDAPQGVSTGPRFYDYGPGTNFGGHIIMRHGTRPFLFVGYEAHHIHVLDGVRANHLLQRGRADLLLPVKGRLGMSLTGEFFDRRTFYQVPDVERAHFQFPQFRVGLTWRSP